MKITYTGTHDIVEVPDYGLAAGRGETIDVPAAAVGALCAGDWEPADADAKREWKKAEAAREDEPEPKEAPEAVADTEGASE